MGKYYKHPKFGRVYGEALATPRGRACWISLVNPKDPPPPSAGQPPGKPRYEATILLQKDNAKVISFVKALHVMVQEMLVEYNQGNKAKLAIDSELYDGDAADLEKYPYYAGCWTLLARNEKQPEVVNSSKPKPQAIAKSGIIGGNLIRLIVTPHIGPTGVSFKLNIAQFVDDDGVRFGGGVRDYSAMLVDDEAVDEDDDGLEKEAKKISASGSDLPADSAPVMEAQPKAKGKKAAINLL